MTKKSDKSQISEFEALFADVKTLKSDNTYLPPRQIKQKTAKYHSAQKAKQRETASFEFSDGFVAAFDEQKVLSFSQANFPRERFKALKRGFIAPELELDLHGMTRRQAKSEIAAAIAYAYQHHLECIKIVHGVSGGILKTHTPHWLIQHPKVLAFHQAPKHHGGKGALLLMITVDI